MDLATDADADQATSLMSLEVAHVDEGCARSCHDQTSSIGFVLFSEHACLMEMAFSCVFENPKPKSKLKCTFDRHTIEEWLSPQCSPNKIHRALRMRRQVSLQ